MTLRHFPCFMTILLGCAISCGTSAQSMSTDQAVDLPLSSGVTQRLLWTAPRNPRGTVVMLTSSPMSRHWDGNTST